MVIRAKHPPWAGFLSPSMGAAPRAPPSKRHLWETAALGGGKRAEIEKIEASGRPTGSGDKFFLKKVVFGAPDGFKNLTRFMRNPNMCLVLKLDNGKMVSIANGQNHRRTYHPVRY